MATLRIDHNVFEPLMLDDKTLSYGSLRYKPRMTEPTPSDNDHYLQIVFNDDHKAESETILQLNATEIIQLHNVITAFLLQRIRKHQESNESDTISV